MGELLEKKMKTQGEGSCEWPHVKEWV